MEQYFDRVVLERGTVLFHRGDKTDAIYMLQEGFVKLR